MSHPLPGGYKTFFILNSAEHDINRAPNVLKNANNFGILTFISRINTTSGSFKARKS